MTSTDTAQAAIKVWATLSPAMLRAVDAVRPIRQDGIDKRSLYRGDAGTTTRCALMTRGILELQTCDASGIAAYVLTPMGRMVHAIVKTNVGEVLAWAAQRDADALAVETAPAREKATLDGVSSTQLVVGQRLRVMGKFLQVLRVVSTPRGLAVQVDVGDRSTAPIWYGDHPEAQASVAALEAGHGLRDAERRGWAGNRNAVRHALGLLLTDCAIPGWVSHAATADGRVIACVNLPRNADPARALDLVTRYMPYRNARVRLSGSALYPTIFVDQAPEEATT